MPAAFIAITFFMGKTLLKAVVLAAIWRLYARCLCAKFPNVLQYRGV